MTEVIFLGDHNRKIRRRAILFKLVRMKCISWSTTKAVNHYNKITTTKKTKNKKTCKRFSRVEHIHAVYTIVSAPLQWFIAIKYAI